MNIDEGSGKRGWVLMRQSLHDPLLVRGGVPHLQPNCSNCPLWCARVPRALDLATSLMEAHARCTHTQVMNVESETVGGVAAHTRRVLEFMLQQCQGLAIDVGQLRDK